MLLDRHTARHQLDWQGSIIFQMYQHKLKELYFWIQNAKFYYHVECSSILSDHILTHFSWLWIFISISENEFWSLSLLPMVYCKFIMSGIWQHSGTIWRLRCCCWCWCGKGKVDYCQRGNKKGRDQWYPERRVVDRDLSLCIVQQSCGCQDTENFGC